tara:strand:+ start:787 stop:1362 length:576 start_codon:yes stop_codon:yes gene_type:complete
MARFDIKNYTLIKDRLIAFREEFPQCTIETTLLASNNIVDSPTGEMCNEYVMKAIVTPNPLAEPEVQYTGHAAERDNGHFVNKSSAIENCETSAVGRALAHCGYGGDTAFASAEEVANAMIKQNKVKVTTRELDILNESFASARPFLSEKEVTAYNDRRSQNYYDTKTKWYKSVMHFLLLTKPKPEVKNVK